MQEQVAVSDQSESPKLVLAGKAVQPLNIDPEDSDLDRGFAELKLAVILTYIREIDVFDDDNVFTKAVLDLLETVLDAKNNDAQLKQVIDALVKGCAKSPDKMRFAFIMQKLFWNPKLHARLPEKGGSVELSNNVLESLENLANDDSKHILYIILSKDDFVDLIPNSFLIYLTHYRKLDSDEDKAKVSENVQRIFHEKVLKLTRGTLERLLTWARKNQQPAEFIAEIESHLIYLTHFRKVVPDVDKATYIENVQRIFHEQGAKLTRGTLERLFVWAFLNQYPAEFIAQIKAKILSPQSVQPVALQFFGGGSNVVLLAKAPRKKEVLAARSPSKVAVQPPKAVVQDRWSILNNATPKPPATTEPQIFGGNSDESVARVAVLGPRSPVKAVTQPKEATELVFGGGELPRLLPPFKKAVLVPRSPAKKPSAEEGMAPSKMNLGLN